MKPPDLPPFCPFAFLFEFAFCNMEMMFKSFVLFIIKTWTKNSEAWCSLTGTSLSRVALLYSIFRNRLNTGVNCQGPFASGGSRKIDWAVCDGRDSRKTLFLGRESWSESKRRLCRLHRVEYAGHIKTSFDATDTLDTRYRHQLELIVKEHEGKLSCKKVCINDLCQLDM